MEGVSDEIINSTDISKRRDTPEDLQLVETCPALIQPALLSHDTKELNISSTTCKGEDIKASVLQPVMHCDAFGKDENPETVLQNAVEHSTGERETESVYLEYLEVTTSDVGKSPGEAQAGPSPESKYSESTLDTYITNSCNQSEEMANACDKSSEQFASNTCLVSIQQQAIEKSPEFPSELPANHIEITGISERPQSSECSERHGDSSTNVEEHSSDKCTEETQGNANTLKTASYFSEYPGYIKTTQRSKFQGFLLHFRASRFQNLFNYKNTKASTEGTDNPAFQSSPDHTDDVVEYKRFKKSRRFTRVQTESNEDLKTTAEPLSLRKNKLLRRKLSKVSQHGAEKVRFSVFFLMRRCSHVCHQIVDALKIWRPLMRKVDTRFGASGVAVFNFILDLILLNVLISIIMLSCVVLPTLFLQDDNGFDSEEWSLGWKDRNSDEIAANVTGGQGEGSGNICIDISLSSDDSLVKNCSLAYLQSTGNVWCQNNGSRVNSSHFIRDCHGLTRWLAVLLQGQGIMELSPMFLGYYPAMLTRIGYSVASMHVVAVAAALFVSLVTVARRVGGWLRYNVDVSGGVTFSRVVFSGWNFSLRCSRAVASMQHIMKTELVVALEEVSFQGAKAQRTRGQMALLYLGRIFVNVVIVFLIFVNWVIIYVVIIRQPEWAEWIDALDETWGKISMQFFVDFADTLIVWFLGLLIPPILLRLGSLEQCSNRTALLLYILRSSAIRLASLGVLVFTHLSLVYTRSEDCRPENPCWETHLGQNLYAQLVWAFLVRCIFALLCLSYRIIMQPFVCCTSSVLPDYNVPEKVLDILSLQTLCWLGIPVSPMIPVLTLAYLIILFGLELVDALFITRPSKHVFQASKSSSMFMVAMAVSWVGAVSMAVTVLVFIPSSPGCGPFRGIKAAWTTLTKTICSLPNPLREVLFGLDDLRLSLTLLVVVICFAAYYLMLLNMRRDIIRRLELRLKEASADRAFFKKKYEAEQREVKDT